jgi:hypothetical protein
MDSLDWSDQAHLPCLEDEVRAYLRREQKPPLCLLCWMGMGVIGWVLFLAAGKAVLQLFGLW